MAQLEWQKQRDVIPSLVDCWDSFTDCTNRRDAEIGKSPLAISGQSRNNVLHGELLHIPTIENRCTNPSAHHD